MLSALFPEHNPGAIYTQILNPVLQGSLVLSLWWQQWKARA